MSKEQERVKIWNTFFKLAWAEAKSLFETSNGITSWKRFDPEGGTLSETEFHTLATLILCALAIEARANHLIEELKEQRKISPDVAEAAQYLPLKHKWFLIPQLAGVSNKLDSDHGPHQSISQICHMRNPLLHVDYEELKRKLPSPKTTLSYFSRFIEAMEDMNVVLKRIDEPRNRVKNIGLFP